MATELEVKLTADIRLLKKELDKAKDALRKYDNQTERTTKANKKTSAAAVELGRAMGDLPFGIQGVANNFQQLAYVMGAGAGLQIGIAAVTSLLVVMEKRGITLSSVLKSLTGSSYNYAVAQREAAKASAEFVGSARAEVSELRVLLDIAKNEEKSKQARENAIKRINEKYSKYLGNLTTESINTDKVTESVNKLSDALLNEAKIRGIRSVIEGKFGDIAKRVASNLEAYNSEGSRALREQNKQLRSRQKAIEQTLPSVRKAAENDENARQALISLGDEYDEITKKLSGSGQINRKKGIIADVIKSESKEAESEIQRLQEVLAPLLEFDLLSEKAKPKKILSQEQIDAIFANGELELALEKAQENLQFANKVFVESGAAAKNAVRDGLNDGEWLEFFKIQQLEQAQRALETKLLSIQTKLNDIVTTGITDAISGTAQAIGESIATGANVISSVGASLLGTLGGVLVDLGKMAIAVGIGIKAVKQSLASLNPVVAVAAGAALVAIGSAFKSGASNLAKSGGFSGGGSVAGQGSSGSSSFSGATVSGGGSFNGRVVFEISGQKLIGVLNNSLSANQRLGGNVSLG